MKNVLLICLIIAAFGACKTMESKKCMHMHHMNAMEKSKASMVPKALAGKNIFAKTTLEPRSGSNVHAKAWFAFNEKGDLQVFVKAKNLKEGEHGIHIHEHGDCGAPNSDGMSAGGHYNPEHKAHGVPDPLKHHIGDFGNIMADKNGNATLNLTIPHSEFYPGFEWKNIIGKSLIIHKKRDDLHTQPTGDSGARVACGVISAY